MTLIQLEVEPRTKSIFIDCIPGDELSNVKIGIGGTARNDHSPAIFECINDLSNSGNSLSLCSGAGDGFNNVDSRPQTIAFIASEEKYFIFDDGAADRPAKL